MSEFFITALATNVFGDGSTANYTMNKVDTMPSSCLNGEQFSLIWIAMLGSTAQCIHAASFIGSLCGYSNIETDGILI